MLSMVWYLWIRLTTNSKSEALYGLYIYTIVIISAYNYCTGMVKEVFDQSLFARLRKMPYAAIVKFLHVSENYTKNIFAVYSSQTK